MVMTYALSGDGELFLTFWSVLTEGWKFNWWCCEEWGGEWCSRWNKYTQTNRQNEWCDSINFLNFSTAFRGRKRKKTSWSPGITTFHLQFSLANFSCSSFTLLCLCSMFNVDANKGCISDGFETFCCWHCASAEPVFACLSCVWMDILRAASFSLTSSCFPQWVFFANKLSKMFVVRGKYRGEGTNDCSIHLVSKVWTNVIL